MDGILAKVRWVVLAALLLLSIVQPIPGRTGLPTWTLILIFIGYNLLLELVRRYISWARSFTRISILDLPLTALIYALGTAPGGPIYVLFLLIVTCAAASMSLRTSVIYTATVAVVVAAIAPTLPMWRAGTDDVREFGAQLIVIILVGLGAALLMRRLTYERMLARSSRDEAEQLAELDRLRNEFIASISHDLRTPLTAASAGLGMLETRMTNRLQPQEQRLLRNTRRNIQRLSGLIDNLLAYNQLKAGALLIDHVPVDLCTVATDALSAVQPLIHEKSQILEVDLPELLLVNGDPQLLEQAVVNLLANAHYHTPAGTQIVITGRNLPDAVHLSVRDNGPGIPPEEHEAIFQRFQKGSSSAGSSGLGLAIVRAIVELHGGSVMVDSLPGAGATFDISLPPYQYNDTPDT